MTIFKLDGDRPQIDGTAWLAPSATVIGKVRLMARASVWFGAVIRGDNEWITVGEDSNVQDLCMLHTDWGAPLTIGQKCTIGHNAILHGCTIGDNTLVGMGAVVMNHAVIGKNCLIAARALVPEGKTIPDGSLVVGIPGKVLRQLTEEEQKGLVASAENYAANAARFRSGLSAT